MKTEGFTLIELLAVIVILAIILAVAIPGISGIINSVKVNAYKSQMQLIEDAAKKYVPIELGDIAVNTEMIITLKDLKDNDYIDDNIEDSRTGTRLSDQSWIIVKNVAGVMKYLYGYDTNGLVLQYDGIYNGGLNIHNDNNNVNKGIWKDLSGSNKDGTLTNFDYTANSGWLVDGLKFDGIDDNFKSSDFTALSTFTVQVVLDIPSTTTGAQSTIGFNNYQEGTWQGTPKYSWWKNADYFYNINRTNTKHLQTIIGVVSNTSVTMKINDAAGETINVGSSGLSSIFNVALSKLGSGNYNNFTYYSVRIYNRVLSDEEMKHNFEVDKLRFGL